LIFTSNYKKKMNDNAHNVAQVVRIDDDDSEGDYRFTLARSTLLRRLIFKEEEHWYSDNIPTTYNRTVLYNINI